MRNGSTDSSNDTESIQETKCYPVGIKKADNGFIVRVGCKTFVETDWDKVQKALSEYWKDPLGAKRKWCK